VLGSRVSWLDVENLLPVRMMLLLLLVLLLVLSLVLTLVLARSLRETGRLCKAHVRGGGQGRLVRLRVPL